jgi:hypothetical protein
MIAQKHEKIIGEFPQLPEKHKSAVPIWQAFNRDAQKCSPSHINNSSVSTLH